MMDRHHPRSLAYQLEQLQRHIEELPRSEDSQRLEPDERCILKAFTELRLADAVQLSKVEFEQGYRSTLDDLLSYQAENLWEFSEVITSRYFSHSQPPQQLSPQFQDDDI